MRVARCRAMFDFHFVMAAARFATIRSSVQNVWAPNCEPAAHWLLLIGYPWSQIRSFDCIPLCTFLLCRVANIATREMTHVAIHRDHACLADRRRTPSRLLRDSRPPPAGSSAALKAPRDRWIHSQDRATRRGNLRSCKRPAWRPRTTLFMIWDQAHECAPPEWWALSKDRRSPT
jgi:hypothetical protein